MFLSYFDECGDDGYPVYSSELFVLSSVYMPYSFWHDNYSVIYKFRKFLKESYGMPINQEFHSKEFVTGKYPYNGKYNFQQRKEIVFHFCTMIAGLKLRAIMVVIDKTKIKRPEYNVLKNALTYNVQRIENDLDRRFPDAKFLIITDEGRVGKMRDTTREIQKINYIPSIYNPTGYRREIKKLIEDPLPKSSDQSYFIQIVDLISFIVSLYAKENLCSPKIEWGNRIKNVFDKGDEIKLMDALSKCFNLKASPNSRYGVVHYPK